MKKIFMAIALCLMCAASFATNHTYTKVDTALTNYTGEYIIGIEMGNMFMVLNETNRSMLITKYNDSTIVCDDSISLNLIGTGKDYSISNKNNTKYLNATADFTTGYNYATITYYKNSTIDNFNVAVRGTSYYYYLYYSTSYGKFKTYSTSSYSSSAYVVSLYKRNDYADISVHDTTYVIVHDTLSVEKFIHDTTLITQNHYIYLHDTLYMNNTAHDTVYLPQYITVYDTIIEYLTDTIYETVYLEDNGTALTYNLENYGVTYFYGRVLNVNCIKIKLYSVDGKLIEISNTDISMANKPNGIYIVTDGHGGFFKFIY